jgi:D-alanine-D-alanine ligase
LSETNIKLALIKGGWSAEREVSLNTGQECATALRKLGYNVIEINAVSNLLNDLESIKPDLIFNCLHGRWGEDGVIQACFEWLGIPYTHSGVLASALAMDKQKSRHIFKSIGLPIATGFVIKSEDLQCSHPMTVPYVIKPRNEGSSVGVHIIHDVSEKVNNFSEKLPEYVLIEEFVPGRELTVTVMGNNTLEEIESPTWYDFNAKYSVGGSKHITPAKIPLDVKEACFDYALKAYNVLGCKGVARIDFRWNCTLGVNGLVVLELNTQPGMTKTSLVPEQAKACDISFEDLCRWIVEDASCDR